MRAVFLLLAFALHACWANFEFQTFSEQEDQLYYLIRNKSLVGEPKPAYTEPFPRTDEGWLELTQDKVQTAHAVWYHRKQYIIDGFSAKFSFEVTNRSKTSGDGLAFVIQDEGQSAAGDGTAVPVGSSGMGIGYSGISDSIAVEFDMYRDDNFNDPDDNHISVHSGGAGPNNGDERLPSDGGTLLPSSPKNIYTPPFRMSEGKHSVWIEFRSEKLSSESRISTYIDNFTTPVLTTYVEIKNVIDVPNGYAWVGLTSSTGDAAQQHNVIDFYFEGDAVVHQIVPRAGPTTGATKVSVIGANFKNLPGTSACKFDTVERNTTWFNTTLVYCESPASSSVKRVDWQFTLDGADWLTPALGFDYYTPPTLSVSKPKGGPSTGQTVVTVTGKDFRTDLADITRCKFGEWVTIAEVPSSTEIVCNRTLAHKVGLLQFDISLNDQQYTGNTQDYFFYTPPVIDFFLPIGCEESGGSEITFTGSFTVTKEMVCKFGETALEETPANAKAGSKLYATVDQMFCPCVPKSWGTTTLDISLNNQQFLRAHKAFTYEATIWIFLIAGIVSGTALLATMCCSYFFSQALAFVRKGLPTQAAAPTSTLRQPTTSPRTSGYGSGVSPRTNMSPTTSQSRTPTSNTSGRRGPSPKSSSRGLSPRSSAVANTYNVDVKRQPSPKARFSPTATAKVSPTSKGRASVSRSSELSRADTAATAAPSQDQLLDDALRGLSQAGFGTGPSPRGISRAMNPSHIHVPGGSGTASSPGSAQSNTAIPSLGTFNGVELSQISPATWQSELDKLVSSVHGTGAGAGTGAPRAQQAPSRVMASPRVRPGSAEKREQSSREGNKSSAFDELVKQLEVVQRQHVRNN